MPKKIGPYIGVTGFMTRAEVVHALEVVPEGSTRRMMIGLLMGEKTLGGETNKHPGRYPKRENAGDIFIDDPRALNLVHFNTENPENLVEQLVEVIKYVGPHLDGFQLNIAWPPISEVQKFAKLYPDLFLVLQIGSRAMNAFENMPEHVAGFARGYLPAIDAILIDSSGGRGEVFNPATTLEYFRVFQEEPAIAVGVGGGLSIETAYRLDSVISEFPDLNTDAEGRLRLPPDDRLSVHTARAYFRTIYAKFLVVREAELAMTESRRLRRLELEGS